MTSQLREKIKVRDLYTCKICGISANDEKNYCVGDTIAQKVRKLCEFYLNKDKILIGNMFLSNKTDFS